MKYEDAINEIQGHGAFTICIMLILSIPSFLAALDLNSLIFLNFKPQFNCSDNRLSNISDITWIGNEQCYGNYVDGVNNKSFVCQQFEFDKSAMKRSIVSEFSLVCENEYVMPGIDMSYLFGITIGYFLGIFGDKFGRKKVILVSCIFESIVNIMMPLIPNLWVILVLRVLWGLALSKIYHGMCILMEIVPINKRAFYGNNIWIFWVLGYMLVPGLAYAVRDWRYLRIIGCGPFVLYFLMFIVPESPRWLSINNRNKEAVKTLLYIGKYNGVKLPKTHFDNLVVEIDIQGKVSDLVTYPVLRLKLLVGILAQTTICMSYFGLSINSTLISDNIFINVFVQGALEIFTCPAGWILSSKINRKGSMLMLYIITATSLLINGFIPTDGSLIRDVVKAIFGVIGKFCLTTAFCILDMYLPEIFPTIVRNLAMFLVIAIGSLGSIVAPSINTLGSKLSICLYSVLCICSCILIWFLLPETKGCSLPESLKEGEQLRIGNEILYQRNMTLEKNDKSSEKIDESEMDLLNDN